MLCCENLTMTILSAVSTGNRLLCKAVDCAVDRVQSPTQEVIARGSEVCFCEVSFSEDVWLNAVCLRLPFKSRSRPTSVIH